MTTNDRRNARHRRQPFQQAGLWQEQAGHACMRRRFIRAIRYYQQALDLARDHGITQIHGEICRDLGYLYLHHGDFEKSRLLLEEGLAIGDLAPIVRLGLLGNLISVHLATEQYTAALGTAETALGLYRIAYPNRDRIPPAVAVSREELERLRQKIARIVDLLHSGIARDRLQIEFQPAPPPW